MNLRYVRPDENWMRFATSITASSAQVGYPATRVADQDPAWPWWASSGTATLTINLGAVRSIGIIALIMNNGDDARTITIGGDVSTTIAAARQVNAYPKNVAYIPTVPFNGQNFTIAISSNSLNWAIGEVVIGTLRELSDHDFILGTRRERSRHVVMDVDEQFEHEIRHDLGAERWSVSGRNVETNTSYLLTEAWWESTNGGVYPTLIVPTAWGTESRLVRMDAAFGTTDEIGGAWHFLDLTLTEQARGILVI